jgi:hypothetical protein
LPFFEPPVFVYSNGTAFFSSNGGKENELVSRVYQCLDRVLLSKDDTDIIISNETFALVCEEEKKVEFGGPKCEGNPDICIPKCCPPNEVFNVDPYR